MATEPQSGTVSAEQAMALLLLDTPAELKRLERASAFRPMEPGRYRLVELVQGFARHVRKAEAPVSSAALAAHLCCVPSYIRKLVEQGVIERRADGRFDQDQCRTKYIAHLRVERQRSPKSAAETNFTTAKAELIRIRIEEKQRQLVPRDDLDALIDEIAGVTLTALSSMPARCAPRGDLTVRRCIEQVVREVRTEIAKVCQEMADKSGEPQ